MSETSNMSNFDFERWLRDLIPYINEETSAALQVWNAQWRSYQSSRRDAEALPNENNRQKRQQQAEQLFTLESAIAETLATLFLETPKPSDAVGLWDGGKQRDNLQQREQAILAIRGMVSRAYEELRVDGIGFRQGMTVQTTAFKKSPTITVAAKVGASIQKKLDQPGEAKGEDTSPGQAREPEAQYLETDTDYLSDLFEEYEYA